jgi:pimeloyl-ACP methyl ester carboxylesterase
MDIPEVRYARNGDVSIAYQVVGDGPLDTVLVPDWVSNLVWQWHAPRWRAFYERMASFSRLILFDKRGTGLSDRPGFFPDLETRMDDVRVVMDSAGSDGAALVASHEGCWMAALFAATYPEATHSLVLYHPWLPGPDHGLSGGSEAEIRDSWERWGTPDFAIEHLRDGAPTLAGDPEYQSWYVDLIRLGASFSKSANEGQ